MEKQHYVYVLVDPRTGWRVYAGKTASPELRAAQHQDATYATSRAMREWKDTLATAGLRPLFHIVEVCDEGAVDEAESRWIRKLWAECPLALNQQDNEVAELTRKVREAEAALLDEPKGQRVRFADSEKRKGTRWVSKFANRLYPAHAVAADNQEGPAPGVLKADTLAARKEPSRLEVVYRRR